jgi:hypothetical protein
LENLSQVAGSLTVLNLSIEVHYIIVTSEAYKILDHHTMMKRGYWIYIYAAGAARAGTLNFAANSSNSVSF